MPVGADFFLGRHPTAKGLHAIACLAQGNSRGHMQTGHRIEGTSVVYGLTSKPLGRNDSSKREAQGLPLLYDVEWQVDSTERGMARSAPIKDHWSFATARQISMLPCRSFKSHASACLADVAAICSQKSFSAVTLYVTSTQDSLHRRETQASMRSQCAAAIARVGAAEHSRVKWEVHMRQDSTERRSEPSTDGFGVHFATGLQLLPKIQPTSRPSNQQGSMCGTTVISGGLGGLSSVSTLSICRN